MPLLRNTPGCSLQLPVVPGTASEQSEFGGAVRQPWEAGLEQAAACLSSRSACGGLMGALTGKVLSHESGIQTSQLSPRLTIAAVQPA